MQAQANHRKAPAASRKAAIAPEAVLSASGASRTLMVLGLLKAGPRHGYELHRIVVAHGSLYADFKKPTLYHLLHRLAMQGAVQVRSEGGARGPRGERLVFALTRKGEVLFMKLLREALSSYDSAQTFFEVAAAFLGILPGAEAQALLKKRRQVVRFRRAEVIAEIESMSTHPESERMAARLLATGHALMLMDAEIAWTDRAVRQIGAGHRQAAAAIAGQALKLNRAVGQ